MVKKSTLSTVAFMPSHQIQVKVFEVGFTNLSGFYVYELRLANEHYVFGINII